MVWFSLWTLLQSVQLALGSKNHLSSVNGEFFLHGKVVRHERSHTPLVSAKIENEWWDASFPLYAFMLGIGTLKVKHSTKKFETQVFTKFFICVCYFYCRVYCWMFQLKQFDPLPHAVSYTAVLSVRDWKWLQTELYRGKNCHTLKNVNGHG
jgi:hypothetical protein